MPDDTPVRSRLYDMARDIIEKPTNKNIITLRDEALRMHDDSQKWAHQADALELETDRLKAEVERLKYRLLGLGVKIDPGVTEAMKANRE